MVITGRHFSREYKTCIWLSNVIKISTYCDVSIVMLFHLVGGSFADYGMHMCVSRRIAWYERSNNVIYIFDGM